MFPILLQQLYATARRPAARQRRSLWPADGRARRSINLALQGGGALGAFTWGVLDQLLADGRFEIVGLSGASAGAVNAVVLADGLIRGGPEEARARLTAFWRAVSVDGHLPDLQRGVAERMFSFIPREGSWLGPLSRFWSPYDLNPLNLNPLKDVIERFVDFERLRRERRLDLFIAATEVATGAPRIFTRKEVSADVVLASACLPLLFRAVEIGGNAYWDGGYSGNPPLTPFLRASGTEDTLLVQLNPVESGRLPTRARAIMSRISEITFNASLLSELRAIEFVNRLIDEGRLPRGTGRSEFRRMRLHRIALEDHALGARSTLRTEFEYFETLHKLGQRATRRFLDAHGNDVGRRSTIHDAAAAKAEVA
jgi:NTE family protein